MSAICASAAPMTDRLDMVDHVSEKLGDLLQKLWEVNGKGKRMTREQVRWVVSTFFKPLIGDPHSPLWKDFRKKLTDTDNHSPYQGE